MRQREEAPQAREDLDEPCGPSPIEYPYRCPVCGTELLVNEAIIDAGIGMAKFQNDYYPGFMPKVGCPGCNGDTIAGIRLTRDILLPQSLTTMA
jgi:hypothetical protein